MKGTSEVDHDKLEDECEDLTDLLQFLSEMLEQCDANGNRTCSELLTNTLLSLCYMQIVLPALVLTKPSSIGI
jgi:hypothetical protein